MGTLLSLEYYLSREQIQTVDFARYSPQSRRIMDLWGLLEDKSQEPVYGSHIPVPLEPSRDSVNQKISLGGSMDLKRKISDNRT